MPTKDSSVKGLRLSDTLWAEIDQAAAQAKETRNEWISKRMPWLLSHDCEGGKSAEKVTHSANSVRFVNG